MNIFAFGRRLLICITVLVIVIHGALCHIGSRVDCWSGSIEYVLKGLFVMWMIAFGIGWIMRGLLDVPMGKDKKK
jgi:hypothetical protein